MATIRPEKMFSLINRVEYKTVGLSVDYSIYRSYEDGICYLIFQPSNQKQDWIINFDFPVKPYKKQQRKLRYHGGYVRAWKSCNDAIMEEFISVCGNQFEPYIIGWSYGGAMAQIAAEDYNYRTGKHPSVYTFGSPKVCWGKTADTIRLLCFEIKNYSHVNDIVTKMPPFTGYRLPNKVSVGESEKKWYRIFNPWKWHCIYGNYSLYL